MEEGEKVRRKLSIEEEKERSSTRGRGREYGWIR